MPLTQKELNWLEDQLEHEQLMVSKFNDYASNASDSQVRSLCQEIAQKHQGHYNILMNHLKSS